MSLPLLLTPLVVTPQGPGYRDPVQDAWMNKDGQFLYSEKGVFFQLFRKKNDKSSSVLPFQAFLQYFIEFNLTKESEPLLVKEACFELYCKRFRLRYLFHYNY